MGCHPSFISYSKCPNPICCSGIKQISHIDEFEFEHNEFNKSKDPSTKINNQINQANTSELSENLNLKLSFHGTFKKVEKEKYFGKVEKEEIENKSKSTYDHYKSNHSIFSNLQIPLENSICIAEIEKSSLNLNTRKSFILLLKEFNFIYKLFRKCNNLSLDDIEKQNPSILTNENSFNSQNSLNISIQSNNTLNSRNKNSNLYEIKSTILKESKIKSSNKEYFDKLKNLFYIPIISLSGEINNSFLIKNENLTKFLMKEFIIESSYSSPIKECFLNWVENIYLNINSVNLNENIKMNKSNYELQISPYIIHLFKFFDSNLIKKKNLKFIFDLETLVFTKNQKNKFGISLCDFEICDEFLIFFKNFDFIKNFHTIIQSISHLIENNFSFKLKELKFYFICELYSSLSLVQIELRFSCNSNFSDILEFLGNLSQNVFEFKPNFIKFTKMIKDTEEFSLVFQSTCDLVEFENLELCEVKFFKSFSDKNVNFLFNSVKNLKIKKEIISLKNFSDAFPEIGYEYEL